MKRVLSPGIILSVFGGTILIAAVASAIYFYSQYQRTKLLLQNPGEAGKEEVQKMVTKVGKLIELPSDEQPSIATIADITKLKDQPFFSRAKNGDKVLIYTNAKKAILFDPVANKIIDVAPVTIGTTSATVAPTPAPTTIALYNGTSTVGLAQMIEKELKTKITPFPFSVILKENAGKKDYEHTIVVDVNGSKAEAARTIASQLKADVGSLPEGETRPQADILILIGTDYTKK